MAAGEGKSKEDPLFSEPEAEGTLAVATAT